MLFFCALGALPRKKFEKNAFGFVIYIFPQETAYEVWKQVGLNAKY
jgi:hypothetical protein